MRTIKQQEGNYTVGELVSEVLVSLTLFDMGGGGGMMAPQMFLTTVLKLLGGGS